MKKLLFFISVLLLTNVAWSQWDGTSVPWSYGSGTQTDPYQISTPGHLAYLADMVSSGVNNYQNKYFLLTQDISLSNQSWLPIGNETNSFKGNFDGGGHMIDSVLINDYCWRGLFGHVEGGIIKDIRCTVNIESCTTGCSTNDSYRYYCGGIVAYCNNNSLINQCTAYGTIIGYRNTGGIVGKSDTCTIDNCNSYVAISNFSSYPVYSYPDQIGGIVGAANLTNISRCMNYGNISGCHYTGGIVGLYHGSNSWTNPSVITKCGNCGNITINNYQYIYNNHYYYAIGYAAGISGYTQNEVIISICYNRGNLTQYSSNTSGYMAGIAYTGSSSVHVQYCYNTGNIQFIGSYYSSAFGISYYVDKNCYNVGAMSYTTQSGTVTDNSSFYGVGDYCTGSSYYLNTVSSYGCGSARSEANMKSESFPVMLNTDSTVYVTDDDSVNGGYPVFSFVPVYSVITDTASSITSYSAQLNGHYSGTADSAGFVYWVVGATDTSRIVIAGATPVHIVANNLQPSTTYGFQFFAKAGDYLKYGTVKTFTTRTLYTVTVAANDASFGSVTGGGIFSYGQQATVTATPNENCNFLQWSNGENANPYSFTVQSDVSLVAIFEPVSLPQFTVTATSSNDEYGTVSGSGTYSQGQQATLTATSNEGYGFTGWSNGAVANPYTFAVYEDVELVANFEPVDVPHFTVTVTTNNEAYGTASGGGEYTYGQVATVTATPKPGCGFLYWSNGSVMNPYSFAVYEDVVLVANFDIYNGIEVTDAKDFTIVQTKEGIVLYGADNKSVLVNDMLGRKVKQIQNYGGEKISLPTSGIYFIRVDEIAKRVVVVR